MGCVLIALAAPALVNCTDPAPPATEPTKKGFSFAGWYKDKKLTQEFDFNAEKITQNITLYAKWIEAYTVAFNLNGGTPNEEDKTLAHGEKVQQPSPNSTKTDSTFAGWYKDEALSQAFDFDNETITAYTAVCNDYGSTEADEQDRCKEESWVVKNAPQVAFL